MSRFTLKLADRYMGGNRCILFIYDSGIIDGKYTYAGLGSMNQSNYIPILS